MAGCESSITNVSSNLSFNRENYSKLLQAFKETHEEANGLSFPIIDKRFEQFVGE